MSTHQLGRSNVYEGNQYCSKLYRVHKHSDLIHKVRVDCATVYKLAEISDSSFSARCSNSITSSTQVDRFVSEFFFHSISDVSSRFFWPKIPGGLGSKVVYFEKCQHFWVLIRFGTWRQGKYKSHSGDPIRLIIFFPLNLRCIFKLFLTENC